MSLRLVPPVPLDTKEAVRDDVLPDGTVVLRGERVTYNVYAMGRMDSIWGPDCTEFKPERWLKDGVFVPESSFKFPGRPEKRKRSHTTVTLLATDT
jgi:cytochrome P450